METIRKGYKQTDIGIIPEDWEVKTIGKIFTSFPTASFSREQLGDGNVKYIHYGDIHTKFGAIVNVETTDLPTVSDSQSNRYVKLKNGDIILADASEDYEGVGKCIEILNCQNTPAISGLHTIPLRDSNNEFVDGLRGYIFQSKNVKSQLDRQAVGTKVYSISYNSIKECLIPIPTKIEQRAIAEVLSEIDLLIEVLDKKIAKKRAIKDGAMQQLLTAKKRLPGFSDPWVEKKLGDILDYEQPTNYIIQCNDYLDSGIPVLTAGKTFILGYTHETTGIYDNVPVIIFDDFTTASKYVDFPFKVKSSAMKILTINNIDYNLRFIFELMQIIDFPLSDHQRYWISEYSELIIQLPNNRKEQQAIAEILTDMDDEIELLEQQRSKYTALKQGAMQQLLTGQIRLKTK
ncbi:Type I restriction-modification system, specificity subunit S [Mucinivorans hirudinis]|uniref:Type I restriction-modification system, specificity subunit S n=1 Tax=Mucinivorans hirudinis TaxID=1433126 RepID=A0A060RCZ2_9BACT|nr:Type I restriction-modification system, specificity subunit S [Mucinivorans hirudinis]